MALATLRKVGLSSFLLTCCSCLAKVEASHFLTSSGTASLSSSDKSSETLSLEINVSFPNICFADPFYSLFGVGDNDAENVRDVLEVGHHVVDIDAGGGAQTRDHGVEPAIELH